MAKYKNENTGNKLHYIGAMMIVFAWVFGWIPELGWFLFIGGIVLIIAAFIFN